MTFSSLYLLHCLNDELILLPSHHHNFEYHLQNERERALVYDAHTYNY